MEQYQFQEAMANIRHYSNLRFAMLTVFAAITGGLLTAGFSPSVNIDASLFGINIL